MPLTTVIMAIVAVGFLLWLVNRFIPMQGQIKSILNGVVVIVLVLWLANLYGLLDHLRQFRVGRCQSGLPAWTGARVLLR